MGTLQNPRLKDQYHVEILPGENMVFLLSEYGDIILNGEPFVSMIPLLTGEYTIPELVERLQGKSNFMQVQFALSQLRRRGAIMENYNGGITPEVSAFWNILEADTHTAAEQLTTRTVGLKSFGHVPIDPMRDALTALGIQLAGGDGDFTVVLTDDYLQLGLAEFNAQAIQNKQPWLLVKPVGATLWVGPMFIPEKTGCWACLEQRLSLNREIHAFLQAQKNQETPFPLSRAIVPSSLQVAANMAAIEVLKWLLKGENPAVEGSLLRYNILTSKQDQHMLVKRPQCPVCGDYVYPTEPQPLELQSAKKRFTSDGGHRTLTPEEMLKKHEHHVSDLLGAVNYLDIRYEIPGLIYVYSAYNNLKVRYMRWIDLFNSRFQRSGGKGMTMLQAKASGLGEAIERYCGGVTGHELKITASYDEIKADAIHPTRLLQFSVQQYRDWEKWREIGQRQIVPVPFREDQAYEWTPVWSLTQNRVKYVPTAFCYYGYWRYDQVATEAFCWGDSNGCASGNTLEEAILQGFMELVERDCIAIWWYNRVQRPGIDLDSFNVPYFRQLKQYYAEQGRELWLLDITNDLGIPTFAGVTYKPDSPDYEEVCVGYGAHFDPRIAASRALTEVNELLSAVVTTRTEKGDYRIDNEIRNWVKNTRIAENQWLTPASDQPVRCYEDFSYQPNQDIRDDILQGVEIMRQLGLEVLVLDQSHPDIDLKVAKVIIPDLRHFWARFAPGRLYDVPVKLGWLEHPKAEEDLNPVPMFF